MTRRRFTLDDQLRFAALSGDANPLHVDPVAARRLMYGQPVVHGIHALLWAIDRWLHDREGADGVRLRALKASFLRPIVLDADVELAVREERESGRVSLELVARGASVLRASLAWEVSGQAPAGRARPACLPPRERTLDDVEGASGELQLTYDPADLEPLLPQVAARLRPLDTALLLATTRLVGVECPGMHSVFSELELAATDGVEEVGDTGDPRLAWRVTRVDRRFALALIALGAAGVRGTIKAFVRPAPRAQPSARELAAQVAPGEFAGWRALVVGGSRGLGEVAAKLLAAGGASVRVTWHRGRDDAERVAAEAAQAGGDVAPLQLDVLRPDRAALRAALGAWAPTHLLYFATPNAFAGAKGVFSRELFESYAAYYVSGFAALVPPLRELGLRAALYPSTVAVADTPPNMGEYAAAKAAGESLCTFLERSHAGLVMHRPRFPRLDTDQTVSLTPVANADPVPVLLAALRALAAATTPGVIRPA